MAEGNGNGSGFRLNTNNLRLIIEVVLLLFGGLMAWSDVKNRVNGLAEDMARLEKMQLSSDAWARDLDIRLAAAGIVPRRDITIRTASPEKDGD